MTLVPSDDDWPIDLRMDEAAWMRVSIERSLSDVVANGVYQWMRETGRQPTDVIFGRKAIRKLRELANQMMVTDGGEIKENKFQGLTFHKDYDVEGVELLTREPL